MARARKVVGRLVDAAVAVDAFFGEVVKLQHELDRQRDLVTEHDLVA